MSRDRSRTTVTAPIPAILEFNYVADKWGEHLTKSAVRLRVFPILVRETLLPHGDIWTLSEK